MSPAVTVITPTIPGRGELLADLAECIATQTRPPSGWLVKWDNDRVGPAAIRNELVARAASEWVAFVDDDDLLDVDHFEVLAPHLDGSADVVWTLPRVPGEPVLEEILHKPFDPEPIRSLDRNTVAVTVVMRRSLFLELGGFDRNTARDEDFELWARALRAGARFRQVRQVTWTYRLDRTWGHRTWQEV